MPLPLGSCSTLRKPSASQSSDISPSKTVAVRTRKITHAKAVTDEESIEIKGSLAKMRELVTHVQVKGAKKSENEEIMERCVMQCE